MVLEIALSPCPGSAYEQNYQTSNPKAKGQVDALHFWRGLAVFCCEVQAIRFRKGRALLRLLNGFAHGNLEFELEAIWNHGNVVVFLR